MTGTLTRLGSSRSLPLAFGFLAGNATLLNAWGMVDAAMVGWAVWLLLRRRFAFPTWIVILAVPVAAGAGWAADPVIPVWTASRFLALAVVAVFVRSRWDDSLSPSWLAAGFAAGIALQTLSFPWVITDGYRPALSFNASILGQSGAVAFMLGALARDRRVKVAAFATALVTLAMAQERSALLAVGIFGLLWKRQDTLLVLCMALAAVLWSAVASDLTYRWRVGSEVSSQIEKRWHTYWGGPWARDAVIRHFEVRGQEAPAYRPPQFLPNGYGYGSYVASTGTQRPHNVPVIIIYDLGLLAMPVFGLMLAALWRHHLPWSVVVGMLALWMLVDDPWSVPPGHYQVAVVLVGFWRPYAAKLPDLLRFRRLGSLTSKM